MVDVAEHVCRTDRIRHMPELDRESIGVQDVCSVRIDVDEVVGIDRQALERTEKECPALAKGSPEHSAPLQLTERRLLALDRAGERIEALEMIPGIERLVPVIAERR